MTQLTISNTNLPAALTSLFTDQAAAELSGGITAGFPVVSFRGRVWRIKAKGEEHIVKDAEGQPRPSIELVLLAANPHLSKIYYDKAYQEGDDAAPRCWSIDGVTPDMQVESPISVQCATCPNNAWGSRITPQGTKVKACVDSKRVAVVPAGDLEGKQFGGPMLLRIPAASLQGLLQYSAQLTNQGVPFFAVVTRLSFDLDASYPKLECTAIRVVTEAEAQVIVRMRDDDAVQRILATMEQPEPVAAQEQMTEEGYVEPAPAPIAPTEGVAVVTETAAPVAAQEEDEEEEDGVIRDSSGTAFDPLVHSSKNGVPTFRKDGTFRKRRATPAKEAAAPAAAPAPEPPPAAPPASTVVAQPSTVEPAGADVDSLLGDVLAPLGG